MTLSKNVVQHFLKNKFGAQFGAEHLYVPPKFEMADGLPKQLRSNPTADLGECGQLRFSSKTCDITSRFFSFFFFPPHHRLQQRLHGVELEENLSYAALTFSLQVPDRPAGSLGGDETRTTNQLKPPVRLSMELPAVGAVVVCGA